MIVGGAGGVGSIMVQLAAKVANLKVIAASRPESAKWVRGLGAHHAIDPRADWREQLSALNVHTACGYTCLAPAWPFEDLPIDELRRAPPPRGILSAACS